MNVNTYFERILISFKIIVYRLRQINLIFSVLINSILIIFVNLLYVVTDLLFLLAWLLPFSIIFIIFFLTR
jgi:hypothetical protein